MVIREIKIPRIFLPLRYTVNVQCHQKEEEKINQKENPSTFPGISSNKNITINLITDQLKMTKPLIRVY